MQCLTVLALFVVSSCVAWLVATPRAAVRVAPKVIKTLVKQQAVARTHTVLTTKHA
jgi:hypothetical protein